ncbi:MAG: hypothetical protein PHD82_02115 [Candidatus Riflebacteria bacterium]|nr:hypothetical protein [Candidatus Riflebacteria bacterium]
MKPARILVIFAFVMLGALAAAQTVSYDGLKFMSMPDLENRQFFGYNFVRVLVTNKSDRVRNIRLFARTDYSRDLEEVTRSFSIQPGEALTEALMVPSADFSSQGVNIEVDGVLLPDYLSKYLRFYRNYYAKKQVLVDSRISRNDFEAAFGSSGKFGHINLELNQFTGSLSQLYRNWLGYAQFNLLMFYAKSLSDMPEPVRLAIFDYVRAGGALLILGQAALPSDFFKKHEDGLWASYEGCFGRVYLFNGDLFATAPVTEPQKIPANSLAPRKNSSHQPVKFKSEQAPDVSVFDLFGGNSLKSDSPLSFKDTEIETVSARWLMLLIYLFAFIIGPVNVYFLHKTGRRIFVFLTVPIASLACCVFIYAYYLVFESSTLLVKKQTLTLLDERENRAVMLGNYSVFSARSRPEGLKFDMQTEVFPLNRDDYRVSDGGKYISLDEDQHFKDGWVKPKIPRYVHVRSIQTRRERVTLSVKNGRLQLMNGLGVDIIKLHLKTADGKTYIIENLGAGNMAELQEQRSGVANTAVTTPAEIFSEHWFRLMPDISSYFQTSYLRPGTYIASLRESPFLRQAIEKEASVSDEACIIGILKEEPQL